MTWIVTKYFMTAAVMVIDAGKGIENQTRKLFEVCRQRGIPILAFLPHPEAVLDILATAPGRYDDYYFLASSNS